MSFSRPSFIDPDEDFDDEMNILHLVSELQKGNDACLRAILKELEDECGPKSKRPIILRILILFRKGKDQNAVENISFFL